MATYTNVEYADILVTYGRANCVSREARRIYAELYPNRRLPSRNVFSATYRRLQETGNVHSRERSVGPRHHGVVVDQRILAAFDEDPTTSIRRVATELGLSTWKVWSVLRQDERHAFHYTKVQGNLLIIIHCFRYSFLKICFGSA